MDIKLPPKVDYILQKLESNGYEAYIVGGCVRDHLLGQEPHDWDICTSAKPENILELFSRYQTNLRGLKHGTITVIIQHEYFEITTFRVDGVYSDNRHPDGVEFVEELQGDLSRRDFTINAMAYHPERGLQDFFHGQDDLNQKVIRCVGVPDNRFQEDALRILRGLRFASVLGFSVETETSASIHRNKDRLTTIAVERFRLELIKLLSGKGAEYILKTYSDVMFTIIPELEHMVGFDARNIAPNRDLWQFTIRAIRYAPADEGVKLALLFQRIGEPYARQGWLSDEKAGEFRGLDSAEIAKNILSRLRYGKVMTREVCTLIPEWNEPITPSHVLLKRKLTKYSPDLLRKMIAMRRANLYARGTESSRVNARLMDKAEKSLNTILKQNQCYSLEQLAVTGDDLKEIGFISGRQIGALLRHLLDLVIEEKLQNKKECLLEEAKSEGERRNYHGWKKTGKYKNRCKS